jgi:hypothetical protein
MERKESLNEEAESLNEVHELSKKEDLEECPSDERELDRDRQASLASSSTARFMIIERKLSTGVDASTCFKNI